MNSHRPLPDHDPAQAVAWWRTRSGWVAIVLLLVLAGRAERRAQQMLWPYLAWVCFATLLNQAVVHLNAPFGR